MTKKEKTLDIGSRRAILRAVRELGRIGFVESGVKKIFYLPIKYYGTCLYTKRIARVTLKNNTVIWVVALGPSEIDTSHKRWRPYWADIAPDGQSKTPTSAKVQGRFFLSRVLGKPLVWAPRQEERGTTVLSVFGCDLTKRERELIGLGLFN